MRLTNIPPFSISITTGFDTWTYFITHAPISSVEEQWLIRRENKTWILKSNRPIWWGKGLKKRRPDYKLIEGGMQSLSTMEKIIEGIEARIRLIEEIK